MLQLHRHVGFVPKRRHGPSRSIISSARPCSGRGTVTRLSALLPPGTEPAAIRSGLEGLVGSHLCCGIDGRLFNSNPMITDQAAIIAAFDFRR
jgi:hypothetical protein